MSSITVGTPLTVLVWQPSFDYYTPPDYTEQFAHVTAIDGTQISFTLDSEPYKGTCNVHALDCDEGEYSVDAGFCSLEPTFTVSASDVYEHYRYLYEG